MIQVYLPGNEDYDSNGDMVIFPDICQVSAELNGSWSATVSHPVDEDGRWEALIDGAVIKMPSFNGDQLFRIRVKTKGDYEGIICECDPIFFDAANDCFLEDVRPSSKDGQDALTIMCAPNDKYSGESDISVISTAYYEYKNLLEAISGSDDNSFLNRWGGEIEYDNFTIRINSTMGTDNGFTFRYGKNIDGVSEIVDMSEVVTRIYPKAFNGRTMTDSYVDSDYVNSYPTVHARTITFDYIKYKDDVTADDAYNSDIVICDSQAELDLALASACQYQFDAGIDQPAVTVTIQGVVPELDEFANVSLSLGDTVYLKHPVLDITTEARVVALTYDCITEQVISVTLGKVAYNYFNSVTSAVSRIQTAVREDGTVRAETVAGVMDMAKASLYAQYDESEAQDVLGILFENNDSTSTLYGAMAIGTQGFMISKTKDSNGDWVWSTWGTADGLVADYIQTGTLSSADGLSYWNLTDSIFRFYDSTYDSYVELDEGYIAFGVGDTEFGKILRRLVDDEPVLAIQDGDAEDIIALGEDGLRLTSTNGFISSRAGTYINNNAGTYALISAGTYIANNAGTYALISAGSDTTECYSRIVNDGTYRYTDLHANDYDWLRVDGVDHFVKASVGVDTTEAYCTVRSDGTNQYVDVRGGTYEYLYTDGANHFTRMSAGVDASEAYVYAVSDGTNRNIDLHANTADYIKIDATNDVIETWASDWTFKGSTLNIMLRINAFSSLPLTVSDDHITSYHYVSYYYLSNPAAQTGDWTITTDTGSLTISGNISGSTGIRILLVKPIVDSVITP